MKGIIFERYERNIPTHTLTLTGKIDLEVDFPGMRYIEFSGINSRGARKSIYTESYPESDAVRVWTGNAACEPTTMTLTVMSFGCDPSLPRPVDMTLSDVIVSMEKDYMDFLDFIQKENSYIVYHDEIRQKWALIYSKEKIEPKKDIVKSPPYIKAEIKFTNVFGRTFPDSSVIDAWINSGGGYYDLDEN